MCAYVWINAHDCSVNKGPKRLLDLWSWIYSQLRTGCWDLRPVSLQNQYTLSTVELSFQARENVECHNYFLLRCMFTLKEPSTLASFCGSPFISQLLCCYYRPAIVAFISSEIPLVCSSLRITGSLKWKGTHVTYGCRNSKKRHSWS